MFFVRYRGAGVVHRRDPRQTLVGRWRKRDDYDRSSSTDWSRGCATGAVPSCGGRGYFKAQAAVTASPVRVKVSVDPGPQVKVAEVALRITDPTAADRRLIAAIRAFPAWNPASRSRPGLAGRHARVIDP